MTTEAAFVQAILDQPADDTSWLVLADWLEENDQPGRSELVRLQVRLRREGDREARRPLEERAQQLLAAKVAPPVATVVNSLGMELALVPPGVFWMGSLPASRSADPDEFPQHRVEITRPFLLGVCPVTQQEYEAVMGVNPSYFSPEHQRGPIRAVVRRRLPVESVSYLDVVTFCRRLSALPPEQAAGRIYRLPTEAEWEYACRAGSSTAYHFGSRLSHRLAHYGSHGGSHPIPVRRFRPNLFGLYDLHGNVWEWCADWYDHSYYDQSPPRDPPGPASGGRRVLRGGGWCSNAALCRSALRGNNAPDARLNYNGFRVALTVPSS